MTTVEEFTDADQVADALDAALSAAFKAETGEARHRSGGMSATGGCRRLFAYHVSGTPMDDGWEPSEMRQAHLGTWQHAGLLPRLAEVLPGALIEEGVEWSLDRSDVGLDPVIVRGRYDLSWGTVAVDLKTVGEHGLARVLRDGGRREHWLQVHGYGAARMQRGHKVTHVAIVYLDRASGEHLVLVEPFREDLMAAAILWHLEVREYAALDPDGAPRDERGPGLSIICDGCPFARRCWGEAPRFGTRQHAVLGENPEAIRSALEMYDRASAAATAAESDKAFAKAILDGEPRGTRPDGWRIRYQSSGERVNQAEAVRLLEAHDLPVPKSPATYSLRVERVPEDKVAKAQETEAKPPTPAEVTKAGPCAARDAGQGCEVCGHRGCGWCPECHPEVPEWTT